MKRKTRKVTAQEMSRWVVSVAESWKLGDRSMSALKTTIIRTNAFVRLLASVSWPGRGAKGDAAVLVTSGR
jgi:hypothetical protein